MNINLTQKETESLLVILNETTTALNEGLNLLYSMSPKEKQELVEELKVIKNIVTKIENNTKVL